MTSRKEAGIYERLGVAPIINAAGDLTKFGGRLMSERVVTAMLQASSASVVIDELQAFAGKRISQVTHSEAAYVVPGAAAGLALAAASCMIVKNMLVAEELPRLPTGAADQILIYRDHLTRYARMLEVTGAKVRVVEGPDEMKTALTKGSVAAFCFLHSGNDTPELFETTVRLTSESGIPMIVDAAVSLPPLVNLHRYSDAGADMVVFSGGKAIGGPQASGFVCGRVDLVTTVAKLHLGPGAIAIGRPMKVGKEEIVGLLEAIEEYLTRPHESELSTWRRSMERLSRSLGSFSGVKVTVENNLPNGRPLPCVVLKFIAEPSRASLLAKMLLDGSPRIALDTSRESFGELLIYPANLRLDEDEIIAAAIKRNLAKIDFDQVVEKMDEYENY